MSELYICLIKWFLSPLASVYFFFFLSFLSDIDEAGRRDHTVVAQTREGTHKNTFLISLLWIPGDTHVLYHPNYSCQPVYHYNIAASTSSSRRAAIAAICRCGYAIMQQHLSDCLRFSGSSCHNCDAPFVLKPLGRPWKCVQPHKSKLQQCSFRKRIYFEFFQSCLRLCRVYMSEKQWI